MSDEAGRLIKVLIVDDSPVVAENLRNMLSTDAGIQIVGIVKNGEEAISFVHGQKPDVITMDVNMPRVNGIEATRTIMETCPLPIIIVSAQLNSEAVATGLLAMEAGAVTVLETPPGPGHPNYTRLANQFVQTVRVMSEVKVVTKWTNTKMKRLESIANKAELENIPSQIGIVAIGASIGGPPVLESILRKLPAGYPFPIVICQHIAAGFTEGLASWLTASSGFPVRIPKEQEMIGPGCAYIAPDGFQMGVNPGGRISLCVGNPENGVRPAVSYLFRSVAQTYGARAVAVLLTGMGRDGADELKLLRDKGAITIAQDAQTSTVHGMPGEAVKLNAAKHILSPDAIASLLNTLARKA